MSDFARRIFPRSLVARLTFFYAATSGILLLVVSFGLLRWALVSSVHREHDEILRGEANELRTLIREYPGNREVLEIEVKAETSHGRPMYMRVIDDRGVVLAESPGMAGLLPGAIFPAIDPEDDRGDGAEARSTADVAEHPVTASSDDRSAVRSFRLMSMSVPAGGHTYLLHVAMDAAYEAGLITRYQKPVAAVMAFATVLSALTGYVLARSGIRPVRRISDTIAQVQSSSLDRRVDVGGFPTEFTRMAETFNAMMERVEDSFVRLSRFSADIAHELRTPVSIMCGQLEVALGRARTVQHYRAALESCLEEGARLTNLINRLLFLARAEAHEAQIGREWVAIRPELEKIREFYEPQAADAGVALEVDAAPALHLHADRALLQSAIGNLVENSLAHTPRGGRITLGAAQSTDHLRLSVQDTGVGIAPEHVSHIFDRFYRADPARPRQGGHAGLGLAIVRSIAILHGGSVSADSGVGRGTTIILDLPNQDDENVISASSSRQLGEIPSSSD